MCHIYIPVVVFFITETLKVFLILQTSSEQCQECDVKVTTLTVHLEPVALQFTPSTAVTTVML